MTEHRNGPVRSVAARESILTATALLFRQEGYDHLTIEGIARAAGVGKQTIYRWWPSRGALIADCLVDGRLIPLDFTVPDTGDLFADVQAWVLSLYAVLDAPNGEELLRSLVAAAAEDAAVGDHLSAGLGVERHLSDRLTAGVRDGQLPGDTPIQQLGNAILGAIILQCLGRQEHGPVQIERLIRFLFTTRA